MITQKHANSTKTKKVSTLKQSIVKLLTILILATTLLISISILASVDNTITESNKRAIARLGIISECNNTDSFNSELACIRSVQNAIRVLLPDQTCPSLSDDLRIEPENFIKRGYGCCYSRARFTEKALRYYGFKTRRVAIHVNGPYGIPGTLMLKTTSHATTEVLTSRGWMGVDSNEPFILLHRSGQPMTFKNFKSHRAELEQNPMPETFYQHEYTVVYGLYSRRGQFHGAPLPFPEINHQEFTYNFTN